MVVMVLVGCIAVNGCNGWVGRWSHPGRTIWASGFQEPVQQHDESALPVSRPFGMALDP